MADIIDVIDWDQIISDRKVQEKLQVEPFYQLRVGDQYYNMKKLSVPNTFKISKPDSSQMEESQIKKFIDLHFDECLQYLSHEDSRGLTDFYEYTSQLSKDKTEVIIHTFKAEDSDTSFDRSKGYTKLTKIIGLSKHSKR